MNDITDLTKNQNTESKKIENIEKVEIFKKTAVITSFAEYKEKNSPIPLTEKIEKENIFPVDDLGDSLKDLVLDLNHVLQASLPICAQSVLSSLALVFQAHANVAINDLIKFPLSNFFITIAGSGERKSTVENAVLFPIHKFQSEARKQYTQDLKKYKVDCLAYGRDIKKGLILNEPEKPIKPLIITEEPTYEGLVKNLEINRGCMGIFTDEGARFLNSYAMTNENLTKTLAGLANIWDGKSISRFRISEESEIIYNRRVSMHLMMQKKISEKLIYNAAIEDQGFLARCLISAPPKKFGDLKFIDNQNIKSKPSYNKFADKIYSYISKDVPIVYGTRNEPNLRDIGLNREAFYVVNDYFYNDLQHRVKGDYAPIEKLIAKGMSHICRLAAILALYEDFNAQTIEARHVMSGIGLFNYYTEEALRLFSYTLNSIDNTDIQEKLQLAQVLSDFLTAYSRKNNTDELTFRNIIRYCPYKIRNKEILLELLDILATHDHIEMLAPNKYKINTSVA